MTHPLNIHVYICKDTEAPAGVELVRSHGADLPGTDLRRAAAESRAAARSCWAKTRSNGPVCQKSPARLASSS